MHKLLQKQKQNGDEAEQLADADAARQEGIHAQFLDQQSPRSIQQQVQAKNIPLCGLLSADHHEKQKDQEIPAGFIKECCHMPAGAGRGVNQNGKRKKTKRRI